jgi:hypothetical protein
MIGFSGRLGFKQYVPLKPTKRGIKVWVRADPHNGYVSDFQVYTGRTDNTPEINLGGRVVLDLMQPLLDLGYHVYRGHGTSFIEPSFCFRPTDVVSPSQLVDNIEMFFLSRQTVILMSPFCLMVDCPCSFIFSLSNPVGRPLRLDLTVPQPRVDRFRN